MQLVPLVVVVVVEWVDWEWLEGDVELVEDVDKPELEVEVGTSDPCLQSKYPGDP